jgi:outer membrane phospholipase A
LQEIEQLKTQLNDQEQMISSLQEIFQSAQTQQEEQNIATLKDLKSSHRAVSTLKEDLGTQLESILHNLQGLQAHSRELMEQQQQLQRRIQIALGLLILTLFAICIYIF